MLLTNRKWCTSRQLRHCGHNLFQHGSIFQDFCWSIIYVHLFQVSVLHILSDGTCRYWKLILQSSGIIVSFGNIIVNNFIVCSFQFCGLFLFVDIYIYIVVRLLKIVYIIYIYIFIRF